MEITVRIKHIGIIGYSKVSNYKGSFSAWDGTEQEIDKTILKELDN